jgi:hypothetical protein
MEKDNFSVLGMLAMVLVFNFALSGCGSTPPADVRGENNTSPSTQILSNWWIMNDDDSPIMADYNLAGVCVVTGTPQLPDDVGSAKLGYEFENLEAGKTYEVIIELWADSEFRNVIAEFWEGAPKKSTRVGRQDAWWFTIPETKTSFFYEVTPIESGNVAILLLIGGDTGTIHIGNTTIVEKK